MIADDTARAKCANRVPEGWSRSPSVRWPRSGRGVASSWLMALGSVGLLSCAIAPSSGEEVATEQESLALTPDFGEPITGLSPSELLQFEAGRDAFQEVESPDTDGLGPVFNEASCGTCHSTPAVGGGSMRLEKRFGTTIAGNFDPLTQFGGSLIQDHAIGPRGACNYVPELVPAQATLQAGRRATPLFGLGLVDAVPDSTFQELAANQATDSPGTAGIVSTVTSLSTGHPAVGKFGWKGQNPSLFQFSGDAYLNEMGITSPQFPNENCPQGDCTLLSCNPVPGLNDDGTDVAAFRDFMTFLAPPPRGTIGNDAKNGEKEFNKIGCNACHLASLETGASPIAALSHVTFHPYSDFLLHDMGSLGDGIQQNGATGNLMRTAPLWGLRQVTTFLHDGRATSVTSAILAHEGQGQAARDAFSRLPDVQRAKILAFLSSL